MKKTALALSALFVVAGCASTKRPMAMAMLVPAGSQSARGMVHLQELKGGGVEVDLDLMGVPAGVHGFHVHEVGDCGNNGQNAGGHFNPAGVIHGAPEAVSHHAGDFGNVTADASGNVKMKFTTNSISLKEGTSNYAVGRAIVLHANPDDLMTQPTGNAGGRIACGVVNVMAADMHH
jgi:Cu-Zn family superoxide dismutase